MSRISFSHATAIGMMTLALSACATTSGSKDQAPVPRVSSVDLNKYAGSWYVIAAIPLAAERPAYNPVETYTVKPDGTIDTSYAFRKAAFDGKLETKPTTATIEPNTNNAEWQVKTIWPLEEQYVVSYLAPDYSAAIVGRDARDHVWILARTSKLPDTLMEEYKQKIAAMGYDVGQLYVFPQNGTKSLAEPEHAS